MTMFIHFFCLCPLSLTIKLNFDISKMAYCLRVSQVHLCIVKRQMILLGGSEMSAIIEEGWQKALKAVR